MKKIGNAIVKLRKWIIGITLLVTAVMAWFFKDLQVDPDVFNYLPDDDPKAVLFKEVGLKYGGNYIGVIGLETENVFNTTTLEHVRSITDSLRFTDGVGSVTSLTNVIDIRRSDLGIEIGKLVDEYRLPDTEEELRALKEYTLSQDMYRGTIVSDDGTFTAIMVRINEGVDKIEVASVIREKIERMGLPEKIYFGGMPFVIKSLGDIIMGDMLFLAPLTAVVIILLLFLSFRNWRGVLLPLLTVLISIVWTIGLMGLLGVKISIISDVIPVILLAVGSAYTIHVINRINETEGDDYKERIRNALNYIIIPVFLAAITTMAGFISFIFGSYLTMISSFGIFMAAGVGFALLLSVTFAPALMAVLPQPGSRGKKTSSRFLNTSLDTLGKAVLNHPNRTIAVWAAILALAVAGLFLIQRKVDVLDYFKRGDETYVSETIFREKFGGTMPVYVIMKGDMQSPEVLTAQKELSAFVKSSPEVTHAQGVSDLIEKMNDVMGEGKRIPDDKWKVEQLWFLLEGQDVMSQLVNYELDEGMLNLTFNSGGLDEMLTFTGDMEDYISRHFPAGDTSAGRAVRQVDFTGLPSLYLNIDRSLLNSQLQSILYAILLVFIMVSLILRSARLGGYASIPILVTLIVLFGFMGLTGIPLDIATVLVGSVSIGIGVDYAIHMITHVNYELRLGQKLPDALHHAVRISGRAIAINVLAVALGFLVLVFSNLVPLQRFGLLVAVTMITSGSAAITLLPALLIKGERFRMKIINRNNDLNTVKK